MQINKGLYAITDCSIKDKNVLLEKTNTILKSGASMIQYRNKDKQSEDKEILALSIKTLCKKYNTPLIINDDVMLAKKINADGVHLGKNDFDPGTARGVLGNKIIGVSCYNEIERAIKAVSDGADYVAFGSFFPSKTKPNAVVATTELIKDAKKRISVPMVAIGGITPENAKPLVDSGIDLLAVINGLYASPDISSSLINYKKLFD